MQNYSPLVLAYLGDSVYELFVREYLVNKGITKVHELQTKSLDYVSAKSQRRILEELENNNILNDNELEIVKWGRNAKGRISKTTDIVTYRTSTGFECLIGYLYLNNKERLKEVIEHILK